MTFASASLTHSPTSPTAASSNPASLQSFSTASRTEARLAGSEVMFNSTGCISEGVLSCLTEILLHNPHIGVTYCYVARSARVCCRRLRRSSLPGGEPLLPALERGQSF